MLGNPLYFPVFRAFNPNGDPLAGGKLYSYEAGTSTPKNTYTDSGLSTPNPNPVILDAYGSAPVWLSGSYKFNLTDANDVQQNGFPIDNVQNDSGATGPAGTFPIATAGGTVDAITADYTPNVTLSNLTTVAFVASGANTVTNPTFSPDGLTARTITKNGGQALAIGDIPAAGFVGILEYNSANTRWELANPATKETPWIVATGTANSITATYSPAIAALADGLILSFRAAAANTSTTPTFSPNGLTARTITKNGGTALAVGDIAGNLAEYFVRYNLANTRWELINPTVPQPSRNAIINGSFDVWQRGTSFIGTAFNYSADRWLVFRNSLDAGMTASRSTDVPTGFRYSIKLQRDNGNALTSNLFSVYALETTDSIQFQGKQTTFSFYAKVGANYTGSTTFTLYSGTGTDQAASSIGSWTGVSAVAASTPSLTTAWTRFYVSAPVGSAATQLGIQISRSSITGTAGADDSIYITGVQLEVGSVATSFEYRPFQVELSLCQRYYTKTFNYATAPAQNAGKAGCLNMLSYNNSYPGLVQWRFPVSMRIAPTITTYNPSAANANWRDFTNTADATVSVDPNTCKGTDGLPIANSGATTGAAIGIHATADAEL